MGIVYGIYFFTVQKNKENIAFSLSNVKEYMGNASKKYGNNLKLIYYFDKKVIYLTDNKYKVLDSIDFDEQLTQYLLKKDELLEIAQYKSIEINNDYFEPTFIYTMVDKEIFENLILNNSKNEWLYFDTYFNKSYKKFINEEELVNFIKKKDYLPMYAGKPE